MTARKINAMHAHYGKMDGLFCRDCCNFITGKYHGKILRKCAAYGLTHSQASDWAGRNTACGLFGTPFDDTVNRALIEVLKSGGRQAEVEPLPGQTKLDI